MGLSYDMNWVDVMEALDAWPEEVIAAVGGDVVELAGWLKLMGEVAAYAAAARDTLARRMAPAVLATKKPDRVIPGIGRLEVTASSTKHAYDAQLLIGKAAAACSIDQETGERVDVETAIRRFAKLAGADTPSFSGWRTGVADELGIRLDQYRTTTHSERKTTIR